MKRSVFLLALLLMVPTASATMIASEDIRVELGETDHVTVQRHYRSITTERISYLVLGKYSPGNMTARDSQGRLECEVDRLSIGSELLCVPRKRSNYTVTISYEGGLSERSGKNRVLSYSNQIFVPTGEVSVRVVLPEGYGVVAGEDAYSPGNASVGSSGRRIFLEWTTRNVSLGDTLVYTVRYEKLGVFEALALRQLTVLLAAVVLLLAGLVVYFSREYGGEKTIASVFPVLKEDEKEVMRYLIDSEGEAEQREIVDNLDYSKAKISRLVSDLEERNLVEKEKRGRVNVVKLTREIGDIEEG